MRLGRVRQVTISVRACLAIRATFPMVASVLVAAVGRAQAPADGGGTTVIYFVRHAEVEPIYPTPLSAPGKARARTFAHAVSGVRFTHVFSTHTLRAYQMVEPVAQEQNLQVRQFPRPGARLGTVVVADSTPAKIAVAPLLGALRALPPGSTALVGVNSDNVYALLNGLGVPVATTGDACAVGSTCVPCLTNACFPGGYDQLWVLVVVPGSQIPRLIELRYGGGAQ
jgi:hypothetical protein